jgi:hypothetical protein
MGLSRIVDNGEMTGQTRHESRKVRQIVLAQDPSAEICDFAPQIAKFTDAGDEHDAAAETGLRELADLQGHVMLNGMSDVARRSDRPSLTHVDHRKEVFGGIERIGMRHVEPLPTQVLFNKTADFGSAGLADERQP